MALDLDVSDQLPQGWRMDVHRLVNGYGEDVLVKGPSPGSLEPPESAGLDYRVVDGTAPFPQWLVSLYARLADNLSFHFRKPILQRAHLPGRININTLARGRRYERHIDQNSHTVVVFCDTHPEVEGGALVVEGEGVFHPHRGRAVGFCGATNPHWVSPFTGRRVRTTIVLSYCEMGWHDVPASDVLYGGEWQ